MKTLGRDPRASSLPDIYEASTPLTIISERITVLNLNLAAMSGLNMRVELKGNHSCTKSFFYLFIYILH